jgi:hypothetical protein
VNPGAPAGQPPAAPAAEGGKKNMKMVYIAVGVVVLLVIIYLLVK